MIPRTCLLILGSVYLLTVPQLFAQTNFNPLGDRTALMDGEKQIRIQVEWIEVSHLKLTELLAKDRRTKPEGLLSSNEKHLRDEVTDLINQGEANIVETMAVIARSGNRAKAESVLEFIYPTEYDGATTTTHTKPNQKDAKETVVKETTYGGPIPAAFEVRNLGSTLEVDPILGADDKTIDLNFAPELVYTAGFENYGKHQDEGIDVEFIMPRIYMAKVTTQVTVINGEYLMAGVVSPRDVESGVPDTSRKLILFVKADILVCGLPIEKK